MSGAMLARTLHGRQEGHRRWRCRCPACGRGNLTICDIPGARHLLWCWNGCGYKEIFVALFAQGLLRGDDDDRPRDGRRQRNREAEERREHEEIAKLTRRIERARDLYRRSVPSWVIEAYWCSRGLALPVPSVLRFLRNCPHRSDPRYDRDYYPAMLAPVINVDGHQIGIHKTFLKPDGSGKWPFSDKCLQRETCGPIRGGAVRLAPCDPGRGLAIAEGIETAASVTQLFDVPAWVALSAPGLAALELPPSICSILICADHDAVGLEAALTAKTRWLSEGRKARLRWPRQAGDDFNDILRRGC